MSEKELTLWTIISILPKMQGNISEKLAPREPTTLFITCGTITKTVSHAPYWRNWGSIKKELILA